MWDKRGMLLVTGMIMQLLGTVSVSHYTNSTKAPLIKKADICIYGGTSAGIIAAVAAKRMGKSVLLVAADRHLGGLTTGGLGSTDIGNKYAITGLSRQFYRDLGTHYGVFEQWKFEPHVASEVFNRYLKEAGIEVLYESPVKEVVKNARQTLTEMITYDPVTRQAKHRIRAAVFIDASYEGDLMAKAGVSYTTGREPNARYKERYNGVQLLTGHQFPDDIDPFKIPGDSSSGLLWGISPAALAAQGTGDKNIQAYNFRICLTRSPANRIPITRPVSYDSSRYELLLRMMQKKPWKSLQDGFIWTKMPNEKTDINNRGGFSTDMIGMNYEYPEGDLQTRKRIIEDHEAYSKGLLYFLGHDGRVDPHIRAEIQQWGYPKDEYVNNDHWTPQLYIREARRMKGMYIMTEANCVGKQVVEDAVGMAAYQMDSHNSQRIVVRKNGKLMVKNEGNVEKGGFPPYGVAYRSLVPKKQECTNLIVPVCLSASHIAYGSIRMEPVFMVLGQAAAVAASMAVDSGVPVQEVSVPTLQQKLADDPLLNGTVPDLLADNDITPETVTYSGQWKTIDKSKRKDKRTRFYGSSMLLHQPDHTEPADVKFTLHAKKSGDYALYLFVPSVAKRTSKMEIQIRQAAAKSQIKTVLPGKISNDWLYIETRHLEKDLPVEIILNNQHADGVVVADAVLAVPKQIQ